MESENAAINFAEFLLKERSIYASAVFFPTVPPHKAALRISLSADHSKSEIDEIVNCLKNESQLCDNTETLEVCI